METTMFTMNNTEGFSQTDLDLINEALNIRLERGEDEKSATDKINNAWRLGSELSDLIQ
jgi:hypothetical protein